MIKITASHSTANPRPSDDRASTSPALAKQRLRASVAPPASEWRGAEARLQEIEDKIEAGDFTAAAVIAGELRRHHGDNPVVLLHTARAWLAAGRAVDAATDAKRAIAIEPQNAGSWYLLGLAHNDLENRSAALEALQRACDLDRGNDGFAAMQAFVEIGGDGSRKAGLARLVALQHANPSDDLIRDLLVRAYLMEAERDWTVVEASSGGATLVRTAAKALRLSGQDDIPPGVYPTTAVHIKTASECLERARSLGSDDRELCAGISELSDDVAAASVRRYNATYGESGIALISIVGGLMMLSSGLGAALLLVTCGAAMIVGSFEPQYRTNRIALSRRGKTIGDSVIGLARSHQYGGLAYMFALLAFFPVIAGYKLYLNRGEGWLARADLPPLPAAAAPAGPLVPAQLASSDEVPRVSCEEIALTPAQGSGPALSPAGETAGEAAIDVEREFDGEDEGLVGGGAAVACASAPAPTIEQALQDEQGVEPATEPSSSPITAEAIVIPEPSIAAAPPPPPPASAGSQAQGAPPGAAGMVDPALPRDVTTATEPSAIQQLRRLLGSNTVGVRLPLVAGLGLLAAGLVAVAAWVWLRPPVTATSTDAALTAQAPTAALPAVPPPLPPPSAARPVSGSPRVLDTATLSFADTKVRISGIAGEGGIPARQMDSFIAEQGGTVSCEALSSGAHLCRTAQGYDLAAAALVNGAARISSDAPQEYREMQAQAQAERKGIWR